MDLENSQIANAILVFATQIMYDIRVFFLSGQEF